jgi:CubicO group peptidase (beta-lactamase class C family)
MPLTRGGLVLAFVCLGGGVASADAIDDYVRTRMQEFNLPGVSIAIVDQGKVVRAGGYGMADPARQVAATPDTVYKIASVSKQFMATAILLLAQEGALSVDDPVGRHLTHAPAAWQGVTIRHLLTHTSGIVRESPAFKYGFGLHVDTLPGGRRVAWHSGGLPGFASYYGRYLGEGVTVIVLTNGNDADPTAIGRGLADRYLASRPAAATSGR